MNKASTQVSGFSMTWILYSMYLHWLPVINPQSNSKLINIWSLMLHLIKQPSIVIN